MSAMALKFDLNLQRLASVVVAINFWELPDVKARIAEYFSKNNFRKVSGGIETVDHEQAWNEIIDEIIHYVQLIIKPKKIQRDIIYFIPFIGEKILDFTKFVIQHGLESNAGNLEKIHFTAVGTINDMKFFRFLREKIVESKFDGAILFYDESLFTLRNLIISAEENDNDFPIEFGGSNQMFFVFVDEPSPEAHHCKRYKKQKYLQFIIRLLNEMSEKEKVKRSICTYSDKFFEMCLTIWPYQEFIFQMLDVIAEVKIIDYYYEKLYRLVFNSMKECHGVRNIFKRNIHYEVLVKLLEVMPVESKRECVMKNRTSLRWFFENYDFAPLALVLSDKDLIEQKSTLIDLGITVLDNVIKNLDFEPVNNFLDAGILSEEEIKAFKNKYTFLLKEFLKWEEFDKADKLLDWMSGSVEERVQIKRQIDIVGICQEYCEKNNFDLPVIDSLLIWQFDSDQEEIKKIKTALTSLELFPNEFCKIWDYYCLLFLCLSKKKCTEFLRWFLDPGDVDKFKKEKLIRDETFVRIFCDRVCPRDFKTIEDLFKFCRIPTNEVENIKRRIRDNMNWWIKLYAVEKSDFERADVLVNWISKNKNQKREIIGNFVNPPNGVECICEILKTRRYSGDVLYFLNQWLKPYGDIETLKEDLVISDEPFDFRNKVISLLNRLENPGLLSSDDLRNFGFNYKDGNDHRFVTQYLLLPSRSNRYDYTFNLACSSFLTWQSISNLFYVRTGNVIPIIAMQSILIGSMISGVYTGFVFKIYEDNWKKATMWRRFFNVSYLSLFAVHSLMGARFLFKHMLK